MNIAVISVTQQGRSCAEHITSALSDMHSVTRYCFYKYSDTDTRPFRDIRILTAEIFHRFDALIFLGAVGIAVRAIAGSVSSKESDPAVLVLDHKGKFVIPILSGHLGGANRLAEMIAQTLHAIPVITTATDIRGAFSPDSFAKANRLLCSDLSAAKEIAAAVLRGEPIGFRSDYPYENLPDSLSLSEDTRLGICVSEHPQDKPFPLTLHLLPKNLVLGIGCKRGVSAEQIAAQIKDANIPLERICAAATIHLKADEQGLLEFCTKHQISLFTYTPDQLMAIDGTFSKSDFVYEITGTDNVCERSAVLHSRGTLLIPKFSGNGVTLAVAQQPILLDFERNIL